MRVARGGLTPSQSVRKPVDAYPTVMDLDHGSSDAGPEVRILRRVSTERSLRSFCPIGRSQAAAVAENSRRAIIEKEIVKRSTGKSLGPITISIGIAQFRAGDVAQTLIERGDKCLYAAKHRGETDWSQS
jgi:GGDEF domain-containing protein